MESVAPHARRLARWHRVVIVLAVAVQGFALARSSLELHPAWQTTLAVAAVVASLMVVRSRRLVVALAANLALTCAVFVGLGMAVGALRSGRAHLPGWTWSHLLVAAGWWWALHAPVVVTRWRTQGMPADVAAWRVFEALIASIAATEMVLLKTGNASATSPWLPLWLTIGALAWTTMPRPTMKASVGPPEHAGQGGGAPYRAVRTQAPAQRWRIPWGRWALFAAMLGWSGALVWQGVWRFRHVGPRGRWSAVESEIRALRVADDPCASGVRGAEHRVFGERRMVQGELVTVWTSGAIVRESWGYGGACEAFPQGRCLPPEVAQRIIASMGTAPTSARDEAWRLVSAPMDTRPLTCVAGRWCSISTESEGSISAGHCGVPRAFCTLRWDGEFHRGMNGRVQQSGRVPAAAARSLITSIEAAANAHGPLAMRSRTQSDHDERYPDGGRQSVFVVGVGPDDTRHPVDFPQARAIQGLLWQRLCDALPGGEEWSSSTPALLPDDP